VKRMLPDSALLGSLRRPIFLDRRFTKSSARNPLDQPHEILARGDRNLDVTILRGDGLFPLGLRVHRSHSSARVLTAAGSRNHLSRLSTAPGHHGGNVMTQEPTK
jgi:hypothetical protein